MRFCKLWVVEKGVEEAGVKGRLGGWVDGPDRWG